MSIDPLHRRPRTGPGGRTEDEQFLNDQAQFTTTDPWRVWRIAGEFVDGFDALAGLGPAVTLFGGARTKRSEPDYQAAVEVARLLGAEGYTVITGGGPGIMEAGNMGAREAGARSIGLNIELPFEQHVNRFTDISVEFRYFFVRKTMFVKYASAFVIFPGGFGTMDELFEALTLIQTRKILNFPVVLYRTAYWRGLIEWIRNAMLAEGKIGPADLDLLITSDEPEEVRDIVLRARDDSAWRTDTETGAHDELMRAYAPAHRDAPEAGA